MAYGYRHTLSHDVLGTQIIDEPGGWDKAKLNLVRHPDYNSLFPEYDGDFTFYGNNGHVNGGLELILEVIRTYGPDATLNYRVEITLDGYSYRELFKGQLLLESIQLTQDNTAQIAIIRDDFVAKFKNRVDTPVDIMSPTDLDGNVTDVFDPIHVTLTPQIIDTRTEVFQENIANTGIVYDAGFTDPAFRPDIVNGQFVQLDLDTTELDEISETFTIPAVPVPIPDTGQSDPAPKITAEYAGVYDIDIRIALTHLQAITLGPDRNAAYQNLNGKLIAFLMIGEGDILTDSIIMPRTDYSDTFIPPGPYIDTTTQEWSVFEYSGSITLKAGDSIRIYFQNISGGDFGYGNNGVTIRQDQIFILGKNNGKGFIEQQPAIEVYSPGDFWSFGNPDPVWKWFENSEDSHIRITGHTIYPEHDAEAFFQHDVAGQIGDRITGQTESVYSEYLGSEETIYRQYDARGCESMRVLIKGLQLRQYLLSEKPFFLSFKQWWEGVNPIFNLGLGVEKVTRNASRIRIEERSFFFNPTPVVYISNVREITKSFDTDYMVKTFRNGYKTWQSADNSGIDDPQTKQVRASRSQKTGVEVTKESEFIAASYAIETTRRATRKKSADYKFDDNTFIIAVNPDDASPTYYKPELDENFESIQNLKNPETRYNTILMPAYNFLRWANVLFGGWQHYIGSFFKFTSGEGNYDVISNYGVSGSCVDLSAELSQKQDIEVTDEIIHRAELYTMVFPIEPETYLEILDNLNNAIAISQTESDHKPFFVKNLSVDVGTWTATLEAWSTVDVEIQVITTEYQNRTCSQVDVDPCADAYLTELGDEFITEDENCLVLN